MSRPTRERNALLLSVGRNAAFSELGLIQVWCNATVRSTVRPPVRTMRKHIDGIVGYIETSLSNGAGA